jgi:hypothetical protein
VTSCSFINEKKFNNYFSVGLENGDIFILNTIDNFKYKLNNTHSNNVRKLKWRHLNENNFNLLSCSDDFSIRLFFIKFF